MPTLIRRYIIVGLIVLLCVLLITVCLLQRDATASRRRDIPENALRTEMDQSLSDRQIALQIDYALPIAPKLKAQHLPETGLSQKSNKELPKVSVDFNVPSWNNDKARAANLDANMLRDDDRDTGVICLKPKPPVLLYHICIYNATQDEYISAALWTINQWEGSTQQAIRRMLQAFANASFIDLGAFIGSHCLFAASLGHRSVCVEPFEDNLALLRKSIWLNQFKPDQISVVQTCLADRSGEFRYQRTQGNPGNSYFILETTVESDSGNGKEPQSPETFVVQNSLKCVTLNELLSAPFNLGPLSPAILKVDIEGSERFVFNLNSAGRFFFEVDIPVIFMEWGNLQTKNPQLSQLDPATKRFLEDMSYTPYHIDRTFRLQRISNVHWNSWPWDIVWLKQKYESFALASFHGPLRTLGNRALGNSYTKPAFVLV